MLGFSILAGASAAKPALGQVTQITEGLINTAIAYEISERCDSIGARWLRGVAVLNGLQNHARELGYTEDEIDAFTSNRAEKDRLEGIARARLVELGAQPGDEASHCAVGRAQIAAGTPVGQLLR
ncbi:DUF5333 domain-containing protein [Pseudoroseicyclus sp. CLL3-39]|uniref:DUF5333 domain-containing protein n=2 Tax=Pseudoroseicyclus tamaricis TaxID=2705421 RepID=A0A6B2JZJ2_9RHOB|nr:DUF5333 domain-containing protein [Pseudoroseicyclus tamaricis]